MLLLDDTLSPLPEAHPVPGSCSTIWGDLLKDGELSVECMYGDCYSLDLFWENECLLSSIDEYTSSFFAFIL